MSLTRPGKLPDYHDPYEALVDLCKGCFPGDVLPDCEVVTGQMLPTSYRHLLDHTEHMTTRLASFHGHPVALSVLAERLEEDCYMREIHLTLADTDCVVEFGIARLDFRFTSAGVREEILAKRKPLGTILIEHDVLRRINPQWFVRFPADGKGRDAFGFPAGHDVYGRIGTIYCNHEPAIELLEIVTAATGE